MLDSTPPYASSVEWVNNGSTIVGASNGGTYVGDFIIFNSLSVPNSVPSVTFTAQMHDKNGDPVIQTGIVYFNVVPEPSSVILFVVGAIAVPLLVVSERRRKSRSQAA